jgi:hypothetical protein
MKTLKTYTAALMMIMLGLANPPGILLLSFPLMYYLAWGVYVYDRKVTP